MKQYKTQTWYCLGVKGGKGRVIKLTYLAPHVRKTQK